MQKQHFDDNDALAATQDDLVSLLNDDLEREYPAITSCVVYSLVPNVAKHISNVGQVDCLGDVPRKSSQPAKIATEAEEILLCDPGNENETMIIGSVPISASRRASTSWPSASATSWCKSRTIRSLWQMPSTWKSPLGPDRKNAD
jgi:hypothetical protein